MSINQYSPELSEAHWLSSEYVKGSSPKPSYSDHNAFGCNHSIPDSTATFRASPCRRHNQPSRRTAMCGIRSNFNVLNNEGEEDLADQELVAENHGESNYSTKTKEPLFEKQLTPSDVGKLNRLVIPKQNAEKYFPLNRGNSADKGLLLTFEDEEGKAWRFRYSYWNSSQSYVLTKGWSRYVKEKRLDAGDVVLFARHREDVGRLFIGWRRGHSGGRKNISGIAQPPAAAGDGGGNWSRVFHADHPYPSHHRGSSSLTYQPDSPLSGSVVMQNQSGTATAASSGSLRRLRLFGVNLEWQADDRLEPSTTGGSPISSQGQSYQQQPRHLNHQTHVERQIFHSP